MEVYFIIIIPYKGLKDREGPLLTQHFPLAAAVLDIHNTGTKTVILPFKVHKYTVRTVSTFQNRVLKWKKKAAAETRLWGRRVTAGVKRREGEEVLGTGILLLMNTYVQPKILGILSTGTYFPSWAPDKF